jgi:hypothetical protein
MQLTAHPTAIGADLVKAIRKLLREEYRTADSFDSFDGFVFRRIVEYAPALAAQGITEDQLVALANLVLDPA